MRPVLLAFCLGVGMASFLPRAIFPGPLFLLTLVFAAMSGFFPQAARRKGLFLAGLAAGFTWADARIFSLQERLIAKTEEVLAQGTVASIPQAIGPGGKSLKFFFDMEKPFSRTLLVFWDASSLDEEILPRAGERWRLRLMIRPLHGRLNPHALDMEGWTFAKGVLGTGKVRQDKENARLNALVFSPKPLLLRLREHLSRRIRHAAGGKGGILAALLVGDESAIDAEDWEAWGRTGVVHALSVSGAHIAFVFGLGMVATIFFWKLAPSLCLRLPAQKAGVLGGLALCAGYALLAGFSVPTQRAFFMAAVLGLALLARRPKNLWSAFLLSAALILAMDPLSVQEMGFWLSFSATAWIFLLLAHSSLGLSRFLGLQLGLALGLAPLAALFFHRLSLVSPLANALAMPFLELGAIPLGFLGLLFPGDLFLRLSGLVVGWVASGLSWLSGFPVVQSLPAPSPAVLLLAFLGVFWLFALKRVRGRWLGLFMLAPSFFPAPSKLLPGEFSLTLLDVGQGLSAVVRTRAHALVYDTGPEWGNTNAARIVLLPYLEGEGTEKMDALVLSHEDRDHAGGALELLQRMPIKDIYSSFAFPRAQACLAGMRFTWDGVDFSFLHPPLGYVADGNGKSCVLLVSSQQGSVLLPGDIGEEEERMLSRKNIRAQVLVASHHGSARASSKAFLDAVHPRWVLVSAGFYNPFHHPHPLTLSRIAASGAGCLSTAQAGAIQVRFQKEGVRFETERRHSHPWRRASLGLCQEEQEARD